MRAAHLIFGTYGFWLPNDPRGSWSDFVAGWDLFRTAGRSTTVNTRRSLASAPHDHEARRAAKAKRHRERRLAGVRFWLVLALTIVVAAVLAARTLGEIERVFGL